MNKNLKPLVLDTSYDISQVMINTIKEIFNKVYVENVHALFESSLVSVKPEIVFINLDIHQRVEAFNLVESLRKLESPPLIYGHVSEPDPDLIAHAVENGFLYVFNTSTDASGLSLIISAHLRRKEALVRDLACYKLNPPFPAEIELDYEVVQIDESGLKLRGRHYISKGTSFELNGYFVKDIFGVDAISVMVIQTSQIENGKGYDMFVEARENLEKNNMALRRYILSKK